MIFFDNAATTPVQRQVADVIYQMLVEDWGNPSSLHRKGYQAEKMMNEAGLSIAQDMGVEASEIIYTSCATESNNMILKGIVKNHPQGNMVISKIEHSSILKTAQHLAQEGYKLRLVDVDAYGRVKAEDVANLVDKNTALVSIMQVNNELGTIEPIGEIGRAIKKKNPHVHFHVDGTQALGKFPLDLQAWNVDSFAASAHKIQGPKGIGLLYLREGLDFPVFIDGGGQQKGRRAGTENVAYICGMARALHLMTNYRLQEEATVRAINKRARERALAIPGTRLNSPNDPLNPYILSIGVEGIKAEPLLHFMEEKDMYFSSGSACSMGSPSPVVEAVQIPKKYREGILRLSFMAENKPEEVDPFFDALEEGIDMIRQVTGWKKDD